MSEDIEFDGHSEEAFAPIRERISIEVGKFVLLDNTVYRISQVLDFESVIGIHVETGQSSPLRVADLRPIQAATSVHCELTEIADEDWRIAEERFAIIKPLIGRDMIGRDDVERRAREVGLDTSTLYRWLQRYNAYEVVTALIPQKRGWKEGKTRISSDADAVINQVIQNYYLTPQRPSAQKAVTEVRRICHERGIQAPSPGTVRSRIAGITEKQKLRGRGYKEKAQNKFLPVPGHFPNADFPLAVIQIDHTPVDIIVVDDLHRKPIGRPWITLAIDVYSRMVTGYYLSFDPPSETSVAMCVAHSVLPKEEWLILHKVDASWPVWGFPKTIHVDNGADFRSNNFQRSCTAYGINLEFRPVKQPRYGGHIERIVGTLMREVHDLPGTTFSSIKDKEGYDPEKHATLTKTELEEWLVTLICKVYHQRLHSGIGISPLKKWETGIFGNASVPGVGMPPRPADRLSVLLDFLPSFRRTVQTFGVTIDGMSYYAEVLRPWISSADPENPNKTREFIFRRDPRDISAIWFFDPDLKQYFKIPFANQALPSMSIWEHQQAKELLKKEGAASVNEPQILQAITELRTKVEESQERSKKARRQAQRRKEHERNISPATPIPVSPTPYLPTPYLNSELLDGDVQDFGGIA